MQGEPSPQSPSGADPPEVSIVIPTRNRPDFVARAIGAALNQEDVKVEVVVVDDGSDRESASVVTRLRNERVRLLQQTRGGVARARNVGIAAARGDWVAFLDDDDVWSPQKLRRQLEAALSETASFVYAGVVVLDEAGHALETLPVPSVEALATQLLRVNVMPAGSSNVMAATKLLRQLGGFDVALSHIADWDLWIRLALSGRAAACGEVLVGYTEHRANWILEDRSTLLTEFRRLLDKHEEQIRSRGVCVDEAMMFRWIAQSHRRSGERWAASRVYLSSAWKHRSLGNAVRALAVLGGERTIRSVRSRPGHSSRPDWLDMYTGSA